MPGFNGTGPQGQGARTGGGFGRCRPTDGQADEQDRVYGVGRGGAPHGDGRGRMFGGGRGRRRQAGQGRMAAGALTPLTNEEELAQLQQQSQAMQQQLTDIQSRIAELTTEA